MSERRAPPDDITAEDFFTRWVPAAVAGDAERRRRLGETRACIRFHLEGEGGGVFTVEIDRSEVRGAPGAAGEPDLEARLDVPTWRALNRGDLSGPEAILRRKLHLSGDLLLALKLHVILG